MVRGFWINGQSLIKVKGGAHLSGSIDQLSELGLSTDGISVQPRFAHEDYKADDFGMIPPDVQWKLGEVRINVTLIHYDWDVLDVCVQEAMGGGADAGFAGTCSPAGTPLGKGLPMFSSGNNLISLNILNEEPNAFNPLRPWRFPSCYLAEAPFVYPLSTKASAVVLNWRAFPYVPIFPSLQYMASGQAVFHEASSSGRVIWDRVSDT